VFERFTERARQTVVQAQAEARALKHDYIGTEHLLLGLLDVEDGLACFVLTTLGVTADRVRSLVAEVVGEGEDEVTGQIPFTPRAKKVLELALREALGLGHNYIGTEHILLGLAREDGGVAARILLDFDVNGEAVRDAVVAQLSATHAIREGRRSARAGVGRRAWFPMREQRPQWEYRIEERPALDAAWMNELGADGWELVAVAEDMYIFKRRCLPPGELRAAG
jgi:ATP-dependent Clp protease ATP-binding subunit ClpC